MKSPLRYPGGKTRAIKHIAQYFPSNLSEMVSPFFGGGSVELHFASQGTKIYGYDSFKELVEFWQCLIKDRFTLAQYVKKYYPISKQEFYTLQKSQKNISNKFERAAAFFVLNRSSFGGLTLSGGMSPGHPRFTEKSIEYLKQFQCPDLACVKQKDFEESLNLHKDMFAFLDPPYKIESENLYGIQGDMHKEFDHEKLFDILKNRKNWVLTYNNCEYIKNLYKDFEIVYPEWKYGMGSNKSSREILIRNC